VALLTSSAQKAALSGSQQARGLKARLFRLANDRMTFQITTKFPPAQLTQRSCSLLGHLRKEPISPATQALGHRLGYRCSQKGLSLSMSSGSLSNPITPPSSDFCMSVFEVQ